MLKAIELSGFKSFANKTRMEFNEGITALVGPNGSGKSNVVDAIKWVLGEQSIKKLRGNEMTDVIFNGSSTRQPVQTAEVTLTFDNKQQIFDIETREVHITRRVYRSGESEYLINRQPSRLKSIKDLLSGTGLGTQAYGIIEQGRVETLLQSSSLQRRSIFEEAAGISRFNMKKQEVQRRLERVEQNILRLSDIVTEVETQLKHTKSQAGKAQLYRKYTTRLQELRVQGSFIDWKKANEQKEKIQQDIHLLAKDETELRNSIETVENTLTQQETLVEEVTERSKKLSGELAAIREKINKENSVIETQTVQLEELETEIRRCSGLLIDLNSKNTDTEENMRQTEEEIRNAEEYFKKVSDDFHCQTQKTDEIAKNFAQAEQKRDELRKKLEDGHRQSSRLAGEIKGLQTRKDEQFKTKAQNEEKHQSLLQTIKELTENCTNFQENFVLLEQNLARAQEKLDAAKAQKLKHQKEQETLREEISSQKQRHSGLSERIAVLEELLKRYEGLSPAVKEILRQPRTPDSPYRFVHGLVADLFRVHVEAASLIEIALGPAAQYVVVSPESDIIRQIERLGAQLPGRVGFLWLESKSVDIAFSRGSKFDGRSGVHGRADQFVETDPMFAGIALRLLGKTWIVESLSHAKSLYRESDGRTNFLTVSGEYLAADGTLIVGPLHGTAGLISRRSEMRTLAEQLQKTQAQVQESELNHEVLMVQLTKDEQTLDLATREHQQILSEMESLRIKRTASDERLQQLENQAVALSDQSESLSRQQESLDQELEKATMEKTRIDEMILTLESDMDLVKAETDQFQELRREQTRNLTNIKIDLAKSEERLGFLRDRIKQIHESQKERTGLAGENRNRLVGLTERHNRLELSVLKTGADLSWLYHHKEELERLAVLDESERQQTVARRSELFNELKRFQKDKTKLQGALHTKQLELERLQQETKSLLQRIMDDYGVDITSWSPSQPQLSVYNGEEDGTDNPQQEMIPENYQQEIEDLRDKIQKLGSVNLEAIEILEGLETRFTTLSNQYNDLYNAKRHIEKIIDRINLDSQRLFEETFEGVKQHFHDIFQKLFGGGHADLLLEDPQHPLECGVEIVARPPGKDLKGVSLLSGGEKTLTCVALLLALFRFRPSPVCILDEVDAALDEANIDRFAKVVKEFETTTQFLIVTHSKKTMAAADAIYGVTMQESGVSTPISVRFVDVGENGEINISGQSNAA